jgi:hypothetical protein
MKLETHFLLGFHVPPARAENLGKLNPPDAELFRSQFTEYNLDWLHEQIEAISQAVIGYAQTFSGRTLQEFFAKFFKHLLSVLPENCQEPWLFPCPLTTEAEVKLLTRTLPESADRIDLTEATGISRTILHGILDQAAQEIIANAAFTDCTKFTAGTLMEIADAFAAATWSYLSSPV